jgi:hypothetical protein
MNNYDVFIDFQNYLFWVEFQKTISLYITTFTLYITGGLKACSLLPYKFVITPPNDL